MKRLIWPILLTTILAACSGIPTPAVVSTAISTPGEESVVSDPEVVTASATVLPVQVVQLGFTISALVKEITVSEGEQVQVGQTLIMLEVPELEYAVVAADAAFRAASLNAELQDMDRVKVVKNNGRVIFVALPHEVKFKAIYKADQAKALLEFAQANLAQATLAAPSAGTVVSVNVIPGELVQTDQVVLTLATLDKLQIETTDLSERDIARVKVGQRVDIYIEALNMTVPGKVTRISPIAETVGGDVVFPVTIELSKQPAGLLWGMTAEVQIATK